MMKNFLADLGALLAGVPSSLGSFARKKLENGPQVIRQIHENSQLNKPFTWQDSIAISLSGEPTY